MIKRYWNGRGRVRGCGGRGPAVLLGGLLLAGALSGCAKGCGGGAAPAAELRVQLWAEPASLDPALAEDGLAMKVLGNVMDGLVGLDAQGKVVPRLAEKIDVSSDGKRYEFQLRSGAQWSDGRPVQVADFVTAIRRVLDPKTASKLAELFYPIRGAQGFQKNPADPAQLGVFEQNGKLVIELERPISYFLQVLTLSVASPARADVLNANGGVWPATAPATGPFRIAERQADRRILLERNPHGRSAALRSIEFLIIPEETTALSLFEQGKLDVVTRVPPLDLESLRKKGVLRTDPFLATYYLAFNARKAPFERKEWRQAVAGSIDRQEIVQALGTGEAPARSWLPPGLEGHEPYSDPRPLFREAVERISRDKGAVEQASARSMSAGFDTRATHSLILEKVQQDLLKTLGLRMQLTNLDWKSYIQVLQTDPPHLYRFGWLAPFQDPVPHLQIFTQGNPNNYTGWSNAVYDRLVGEIETLKPGPEREGRIRAAQKILVEEEAIVIPVYHYVQNHAVADRVQKFRVNPFGILPLEELEVKR